MNARNEARWRAVQVSRAWRGLVRPAVAAVRWDWRGWLVRMWLAIVVARPARWTALAYRLVFTVDGSQRRIAAEHVLADLRDFTFARTSAFDPDPIIMARRQGRRDVWLRISNYLNLDEAQVQKLMEIDDGI